ncbi:hypothetical protein D3C84_644280 [compost metagenome]
MIEPRALENVQHVMHVEFGQAVGHYRACQVGMTVMMKVLAGEHFVHIGIAAGTQQVVQAAAMFIDTISGEAVISNGHQRPQKRQVRPEPVVSADVRALQLPGPRRPQAFARIVGVPHIEVPHLRPDRRGDAKHMPGRDRPGTTGANRHFERLDQGAPVLRVANPLVEGLVHLQGRAFADLIGRRIVFVHGTDPRSVMRSRGKYLQQ